MTHKREAFVNTRIREERPKHLEQAFLQLKLEFVTQTVFCLPGYVVLGGLEYSYQ